MIVLIMKDLNFRILRLLDFAINFANFGNIEIKNGFKYLGDGGDDELKVGTLGGGKYLRNVQKHTRGRVQNR